MSDGTRDPWYAYNDVQTARTYTQDEVDAKVAAAVAAERERCASLAENWPTPDCGGWTLEGLWDAIRAGA